MPASSPRNPPEILRADPRLRHGTLLVVLILLGLGVVGLFGLDRYLQGVAADAQLEPEAVFRKIFNLLRLSFVAGGVGLILSGAYLGRFAMRILASGQFPPPGARVIRDTPILRGAPAKRQGRSMATLAILLVVLGLALPWVPDLLIRPMLYSLPAPPEPVRSIVEPLPADDTIATGIIGYFDFG
jgi:hypothetical protein